MMSLDRLWKNFDNLAVGMEVPLRRRRDAAWLVRNLSTRNSGHEKLDEAIDTLKEIIKKEKCLPKPGPKPPGQRN
ncbi:MAG: hypothetical protein JXK94_07785 [Deltaproteobacteria bacterium]|nr:hypothetical protein [Deltaproteobacteria bacterium]